MWRYSCGGSLRAVGALSVLSALLVAVVNPAHAYEVFDVVSGVMESARFKGKPPLTKLRIAADLLQSKKLKQTDMGFFFLDWADAYLREPPDPLERLKRWTALAHDDKLSKIRIPRDFLNRMLLAEYLVAKTDYLEADPHSKLALLAQLEKQKLVDWSVALAYARVYAGVVISGARANDQTMPRQALKVLKNLKDQGLVGWHYRVPTEAILASELLALDKTYQSDRPIGRLRKISSLETEGLISALTRKELEKLPAWRSLAGDPDFLKADAVVKKRRILKLKDDALISKTTSSDLIEIFCPVPPPAPKEQTPVALPKAVTTPK